MSYEEIEELRAKAWIHYIEKRMELDKEYKEQLELSTEEYIQKLKEEAYNSFIMKCATLENEYEKQLTRIDGLEEHNYANLA